MGEKFSAQNTHKIVAVFMSCFFREDAVNNIRMLTGVLPPRGYKPVFFSTLDDLYFDDLETEGERHVFQTIDVTRFDAVILFSESYKRDEEMLALIKKCNEALVPVVTVDKYLPGSNANIYYDYGTVFDDVCDHMLTCHEFKNIYFMAGPQNNAFSDERISVFLDVCKEHNYDFDMNHLYYGGFWNDPCIECMREIFRKIDAGLDTLPDCIICANDYMAFAVVEFLNNRGYKVPEDIAVSGFDGVPLEKYCTPRLTTACINHHDFLTKLTDTLDTLSLSPKSQLGNITISNYVQIGGSCGCHSEIPGQNYGFDYVHLKNIMNSRLQYEHDVSQLVLGSVNNNASDSRTELPNLINRCNILDFYFIVNQDIVETSLQGFTSQNHAAYMEGSCFTPKMCAFHISPKFERASFTDYSIMDFGEICPDINVKLNAKNFLLCIPVQCDGKCLGYTVAEFNAKFFLYDFYSAYMMNFTHMITNQIHQMTLIQLYMTDSLTGLYNRNGFYNKLNELRQQKKKNDKMSIISMDMDGLKVINDTYGHAEGDNALNELGQFIKNTDGYQLAARMGGDEFIIALFGDNCEQITEQIVNNIKLQISYRNSHTEGTYRLGASIASFTAVLGDHSLDYFMKNADRLMYQRKKEHKSHNYRND